MGFAGGGVVDEGFGLAGATAVEPTVESDVTGDHEVGSTCGHAGLVIGAIEVETSAFVEVAWYPAGGGDRASAGEGISVAGFVGDTSAGVVFEVPVAHGWIAGGVSEVGGFDLVN